MRVIPYSCLLPLFVLCSYYLCSYMTCLFCQRSDRVQSALSSASSSAPLLQEERETERESGCGRAPTVAEGCDMGGGNEGDRDAANHWHV